MNLLKLIRFNNKEPLFLIDKDNMIYCRLSAMTDKTIQQYEQIKNKYFKL